MLKSLKSINIPNCVLKTDFTIPHKMSVDTVISQTVARDHSLEQAYDGFTLRMKQREECKNITDRQCNPLVATQSAPGGGKSFFLDLLALKDNNDLTNYCKDLKMRSIMASSCPVLVTYNNCTTFTSREHDLDVEIGLALRCLFSFFFEMNSSWSNFRRAFAGVKIELQDAIKCIRLATKSPVLLGVDELIKVAGAHYQYPENISEVLTAIGYCLNVFGSDEFNAIVTTLNQQPVLSMSTKTGRVITWVSLPPATFDEAKNLFECPTSALLQCISDCNGHFRLLENLKIVWNQHINSNLTYSTLLSFFIHQLNSSIVNFHKLNVKMIKAALCGRQVYITDSPDNLNTYGDYIAEGSYLNNFGTYDDSERGKTILSKIESYCINNVEFSES